MPGLKEILENIGGNVTPSMMEHEKCFSSKKNASPKKNKLEPKIEEDTSSLFDKRSSLIRRRRLPLDVLLQQKIDIYLAVHGCMMTTKQEFIENLLLSYFTVNKITEEDLKNIIL